MVQISKKQLDKYIFNKLSKVMFSLFSANKDKKTFNTVFQSLFSHTERVMILKRIGMISLLLKSIEHHKIRKSIGVTESTLNRYSLFIERNPNLYKNFIKIIKKDNLVSFFKDLFITIYGPGTPGVNWSEAWKTKREIKRKKEEGI